MRRSRRGSRSIGLVALLAGCATSHPAPLVIEGLLRPTTGPECLYDPASAPSLDDLVLDVSALGDALRPTEEPAGYRAVLLVSSELGWRGGRECTSVVYFLRAEVLVARVEASAPRREPILLDATASGTVGCAREGRARGIAVVELLPRPLAEELLAAGESEVRLEVRLHGRTVADEPVATTPQSVSMHLCRGCLYACAPTDADAFVPCRPGEDELTRVPPGLGGCP